MPSRSFASAFATGRRGAFGSNLPTTNGGGRELQVFSHSRRRNFRSPAPIERSAARRDRFNLGNSRKKMSLRQDKLPLSWAAGRGSGEHGAEGELPDAGIFISSRKTASFAAAQRPEKIQRLIGSSVAGGIAPSTVFARRRVAADFPTDRTGRWNEDSAHDPQNVIGRFRPACVEQFEFAATMVSVLGHEDSRRPGISGRVRCGKAGADLGQLFSKTQRPPCPLVGVSQHCQAPESQAGFRVRHASNAEKQTVAERRLRLAQPIAAGFMKHRQHRRRRRQVEQIHPLKGSRMSRTQKRTNSGVDMPQRSRGQFVCFILKRDIPRFAMAGQMSDQIEENAGPGEMYSANGNPGREDPPAGGPAPAIRHRPVRLRAAKPTSGALLEQERKWFERGHWSVGVEVKSAGDQTSQRSAPGICTQQARGGTQHRTPNSDCPQDQVMGALRRARLRRC